MKKLIKYQMEKEIPSIVEREISEKMNEADVAEEHAGQANKKGAAVVSILEKHDKSLQSPISKLAQRVGKLAWYKHLFLFVIVVAVAAVVGAILQAALIWAVVVAAFYVATIGLLKYHHNCEERRVKTNTKMAAYAEEQLKGGIEEVKNAGQDLDLLSSGLNGTSQMMGSVSQDLARQNEKQTEQTLVTNSLNLRFFQTHTAIEESRQTFVTTTSGLEEIHTRFAENVSHLSEIGQSVGTSSLAIEQVISESEAIHAELAQKADALDAVIETIKENASRGNALLDQIKQSTLELASEMEETAQSRAQLNAALARSTELINGFAANRQQAVGDQNRYEETMGIIETNERFFPGALTGLAF